MPLVAVLGRAAVLAASEILLRAPALFLHFLSQDDYVARLSGERLHALDDLVVDRSQLVLRQLLSEALKGLRLVKRQNVF